MTAKTPRRRPKDIKLRRLPNHSGGCWAVDLYIRNPSEPLSPPRRVQRRFAGSLTRAEALAAATDLIRLGELGRLEQFLESTDRRYRGGLKPGHAFVPGDHGSAGAPQVLRDLAERWYELDIVQAGRKASYRNTVRRHLDRYILPVLGDIPLSSFVPSVVAEWWGQQRRSLRSGEPLAPTTINQRRIYLHALAGFGVRMGWLAANPVEAVSPMADHRPPKPLRMLTADEEVSLLAACERATPPWDTFFPTLLGTGMRIGEALALHAEDVNFASGTMTIHRAWSDGEITTPKSGKARSLPLAASVLRALATQAERVGRKGPLWPSDVQGAKKRAYNDINEKLRELLVAAGVSPERAKELSAHSMRHTYGSSTLRRAAAVGAGVREVQALMGHARVETTERYLHPEPERLRALVEAPMVMAGRGPTETPRAHLPQDQSPPQAGSGGGGLR